MAQPKDESNASTTLPDPELNPLLNPLLAAHMGRWAEVYFTSPPEKRAQAVADLLRELANNPQPERFSVESHEKVPAQAETQLEDVPAQDSFSAAWEPTQACESCGHKNSAAQRFCGMCGISLTISPASSAQPAAKLGPLAQTSWDNPDASLSPIVGQYEPELEDESSTRYHQGAEDISGPLPRASPRHAKALFNKQSEPVHRSYRMYAGTVLAILLVLLVYMAWRGGSAFWSRGTAPSALPREIPVPRASEPATIAEPSANAPTQPSVKDNAGPASTPAALSTQDQSLPSAGSAEDRKTEARKSQDRPTPQIVPVTANSSSNADEANGSEELATAQRYLNGAPGVTRDSRQATPWLWKAVAKQNLTATLLLSDLYLRGDGVTKSCDQARLLLDAAARKGATTAAERLRHLQAFGCQ